MSITTCLSKRNIIITSILVTVIIIVLLLSSSSDLYFLDTSSTNKISEESTSSQSSKNVQEAGTVASSPTTTQVSVSASLSSTLQQKKTASSPATTATGGSTTKRRIIGASPRGGAGGKFRYSAKTHKRKHQHEIVRKDPDIFAQMTSNDTKSDPSLDIGLIMPSVDVEFDLRGNAVDPRTKERLDDISSLSSSSISSDEKVLTAETLLSFIQEKLFDPAELTLSTYKTKSEDFHKKSDVDKFFTSSQNRSANEIWGRWRPTACLDKSTIHCDYLTQKGNGPIAAHGKWFNNRTKEFPNHCCVLASQGRWSNTISPTLFDDMRKMMKKKDGLFSFFEIFRSRIAKPLLEFIPIRKQRKKYMQGTVNADVDFIGNRISEDDNDPVEKAIETLLQNFINAGSNDDVAVQRKIFQQLFSGFGRTEKTQTEFTEKFNDLMFGFLGSRELPLYQAKLMLLLSLSTMKKVDVPVLLPKSKTPHRPSAWTLHADRSDFEHKPATQSIRRLLIQGNSHCRAIMSSFVAIMRQLPMYYDRAHQGISRYVITNYGDYFWFDSKMFVAYGSFYGDIFEKNMTNFDEPFRLSHPDEVVLVEVVASFHCCVEFHESIEPLVKAAFLPKPADNLQQRIENIKKFRKNPINYNEKMAVIDGTKKYPRYGGKFTTSVNPNAQRPLIHNRKRFYGNSDFSALFYRPMMVRQIARVEKDFGLELINEYAQYTVENFLNYDYSTKSVRKDSTNSIDDHDNNDEEERYAAVVSHAYQQYHINRKKVNGRHKIKRSDELMDQYENVYWRKFFLHNHYNNSGGNKDVDSFTEEEKREKERLKKLTKRRVFIPPALPSEDFQSTDVISHTSCIALFFYPARTTALKSAFSDYKGLCEDETSRSIWFKYGFGAFLSSSVMMH